MGTECNEQWRENYVISEHRWAVKQEFNFHNPRQIVGLILCVRIKADDIGVLVYDIDNHGTKKEQIQRKWSRTKARVVHLSETTKQTKEELQ